MLVPYKAPPLRLGDRNNRVFAVKRALLKAGYLTHMGPFPTFFGARVKGAVQKFQGDKWLVRDGEVGPITLEALSPYIDEYGYYLYTGRYPNTPSLQLLEHFTPTHQTGGLDGFPAIDLFAAGGTDVLAPENCKLVWPHLIKWDRTAHVGGWTCYLQGDGCWYFCTHFATLRPRGLYRKGDKIGTVAAVPGGWWPSHIHEGRHEGSFTPGQT